MHKKELFKGIFYYFLFFFVITLDQLIKHRLRSSGGVYVCNQGISFGITISSYFYWIFFAFFFLLSLYLIFKKNALFKTFFVIGLILIFAGAISNASDKFLFNCILDYIYIFSGVFPIFNIADIAISTGSTLIILSLLNKNNNNCV
ncbi:MAG: Lipoprotein signal peptidase [Candidatus Moranbacteria bacterium GW2011_GWE1_36_7]|nr:MAG: Lipoprotein signal peptidase [Candidatus Moranbacteria bacterium GW2011_GWE1_36_7]